MKGYIIVLVLVVLLISGCGKSAVPLEEVVEAEINETVETDLNETEEVNETVDVIETNESEAVVEEIILDNVKVVELARVGETMMFVPKEFTVSQGTTVRWINHIGKIGKSERLAKVTIVGHYGKFRSPILDYNESFDYVCEEKGEIKFGTAPYEAFFKRGEIIVE